MPLFIFLSLLQRMSSILRDEEMSGDLTDACASPRTAPDVVALEGGPQPGGVEHPPNPRGWLPGEVQAITLIYS